MVAAAERERPAALLKSCWPTPATDTANRSSGSTRAVLRSWSFPTPRHATASGRVGRARATRCWAPLLATETAGELYARRNAIEPTFEHTTFNRGIDRCQRRGRTAAHSQWRPITATHNHLKLHRHQRRTSFA